MKHTVTVTFRHNASVAFYDNGVDGEKVILPLDVWEAIGKPDEITLSVEKTDKAKSVDGYRHPPSSKPPPPDDDR